MDKVPIIAIIDPRWHGLGYVDAAVKRGYRVVPIVSDEDHPNKYGYAGKYYDLIIADLEDVDSVIQAIEASKYNKCIDAVIPGNCYFPPMVAKVAAHFHLKGESYEAALRSRLKDLGREAYDAAGIPNLKYAKIHNISEALDAAKNIGYPVVLKPTDGGGSEYVTLIHNETELVVHMKPLMALEKTSFGFDKRQVFLIEEFVEGQEFSVEIFLQHKKVLFSSVTEKLSSPLPYFVEIGHVVPTSVCEDKVEEIKKAAVQAVLALGFLNGPFHVELRLSKRGPVIMETNGRMGGDCIATDLIVNAFGVNLFDVVIESLLGKPFDATLKKKQASAIAYLFAKKDGKVVSINGLEKLNQQKNIVKHCINVKEGDTVHLAKVNEQRLGYVIATAQTPQEAKKSAFDAINSIRLTIQK